LTSTANPNGLGHQLVQNCGCPIAAGDGHDFPRLIDERVPGVAAVIDDVVEGFENSVRQPALPHELPDIFLAVEFGCAWRGELQERDVVWNLEGLWCHAHLAKGRRARVPLPELLVQKILPFMSPLTD
jgi:hypothetical protein